MSSEFQLNLILFTRVIAPKTHENGHNWVLNQKTVVLLLGKDMKNKYTETETWHPERVVERSYYSGECNLKFCYRGIFYRVVRTWGGIILAIETFFKAKNSILWMQNIH